MQLQHVGQQPVSARTRRALSGVAAWAALSAPTWGQAAPVPAAPVTPAPVVATPPQRGGLTPQRGEILYRGKVESFLNGSSKLTMAVAYNTLPNGNTGRLFPKETWSVILTPKTVVLMDGEKKGQLNQIPANSDIVVVGPNSGWKKPLVARALEISSPKPVVEQSRGDTGPIQFPNLIPISYARTPLRDLSVAPTRTSATLEFKYSVDFSKYETTYADWETWGNDKPTVIGILYPEPLSFPGVQIVHKASFETTINGKVITPELGAERLLGRKFNFVPVNGLSELKSTRFSADIKFSTLSLKPDVFSGELHNNSSLVSLNSVRPMPTDPDKVRALLAEDPAFLAVLKEKGLLFSPEQRRGMSSAKLTSEIISGVDRITTYRRLNVRREDNEALEVAKAGIGDCGQTMGLLLSSLQANARPSWHLQGFLKNDPFGPHGRGMTSVNIDNSEEPVILDTTQESANFNSADQLKGVAENPFYISQIGSGYDIERGGKWWMTGNNIDIMNIVIKQGSRITVSALSTYTSSEMTLLK